MKVPTYEEYGIEPGFILRLDDPEYVLTAGEEAYMAACQICEWEEKYLYPDEA